MYFGFGHKFPVSDVLKRDKLVEFNLIQPDGVVKELEAGEGGFLVTPLALRKEGGYIVTAATKHGFYTMVEKNGKIRHKLVSMEGLENVVLSLYFENHTKALINAGEYLKVQVLIDDKPARFCNVFATYIGFSPKEAYAWTSKTNAKGITHIKLLRSGQWILKAEVRRLPSEELKAKVLEEKYTATISFQVN